MLYKTNKNHFVWVKPTGDEYFEPFQVIKEPALRLLYSDGTYSDFYLAKSGPLNFDTNTDDVHFDAEPVRFLTPREQEVIDRSSVFPEMSYGPMGRKPLTPPTGGEFKEDLFYVLRLNELDFIRSSEYIVTNRPVVEILASTPYQKRALESNLGRYIHRIGTETGQQFYLTIREEWGPMLSDWGELRYDRYHSQP